MHRRAALSAFDLVPFRPDPERGASGQLGPGIPEEFAGALPYRYGFGVDARTTRSQSDLTETMRLLELLGSWASTLVNLTAGSPYYNPHIQRPALFPPSRRLPAAGRPARRRGPAGQCGAAS